MQVVAVVVVVVGGCENSFTGYLRGMCRISNVSCISIVWRPCILCTYTRVIHAFGEFYIHFFFYLLVTNRSRQCGCTVYVRTYGTYSEVDHYYRNLTPLIERKKSKMYVCIYVKNDFPPARRPQLRCCSKWVRVSKPPPPWKVHTAAYVLRVIVTVV